MLAADIVHEVFVLVGVVVAVLVPLLVKFGRMQAQNSSDHGQVRASIDALTEAQRATHGEVQAIGDRLDDHIHDHRNQRGAA